MLRIFVQYGDGTQSEVKNMLTAVLNSDSDVPADDIEFTAPFDRRLAQARRIFAYSGDRLVFEGQTDEVISVFDNSGAVIKITARSLAGALLDNEAEPVTYVNPAAPFIFERHLKPFGLKSYDGDEIPFYGSLKIEKGMTHWQVIESFCRNRYACAPHVTGSGRVLMRGFESGETVVFGGTHGIPYFSAREYKSPCKLINEVKLRLDEYGGYSGSIKNGNPECKSIRRVRYVNAVADRTTVKTADKMLEIGNKNSYSLVLECVGCRIDIMGRRAEVHDSLLSKTDGLRVARLRYSLGKDGETTSVTLRKEKF